MLVNEKTSFFSRRVNGQLLMVDKYLCEKMTNRKSNGTEPIKQYIDALLNENMAFSGM